MKQSWTKNLVQSKGYRSFSKRLLLSSVALTVVGLVGQFLFHLQSMSMLVVMGMGMLAVLFFMKAYESPASPSESQEDNAQPGGIWSSDTFAHFVQKLFGWGLAVLIIGLLFWIERWPEWNTLLLCGVPTGILGVVLKLISHRSRNGF